MNKLEQDYLLDCMEAIKQTLMPDNYDALKLINDLEDKIADE